MAPYLLILAVLLALPAFPLEILSDSLTSRRGEVIAEGRVKVFHHEYVIEADRVRYIPQKEEVFAHGKVKITRRDGSLSVKGSFGYVNLKEDRAYFLNVDGKLEKFYVSAERVEQKAKDKYLLRKAQITTCPPNRKELKVCISKASLGRKYLYSIGNSLRFFNVPFVYLPVALFPVGERRSGLLLPMIGSNTYNGLIYRQPIYWVIDRDKDLTLTLDFRDKQAKGAELEYRQAYSDKDSLHTSLSLYKEPSSPGIWWKGRDSSSFRENRYRFALKFKKGKLKVGVDTVSDPFFLEDVYFSQSRRTLPYLTSYLSYTMENELYLASLNLRRYQDLTSQVNRYSFVAPQLGFYLKKKKIKWFYFSLSVEYTKFNEDSALKGQRFKLDPEISLPFRFRPFSFYFSLRSINNFYRLSGDDYDKAVNALLFENRTYTFKSFKLGDYFISNTLEMVYAFQPGKFNNPRFDRLDVVNKRNDLSFRYRGTLLRRGRVIASLFMSAGYNYLASYRFPTDNEIVDKNWLPVRLVASVNLFEGFSYYQDLTYDPNLAILAKSTGYLRYSADKYYLNLGFVSTRNSRKEKLSEQLSFDGRWKGDNFFSGLRLNYDMKEKKLLYREVYAGYRGSCWSLSLILRSTYYGLREDYVNELYLGISIFDLKSLVFPISRN